MILVTNLLQFFYSPIFSISPLIIIKKLGGIALKYCSKCKNLHFSKELDKCPRCGKRLIDEPSHYSPVKIVTANGFELERIRSALTQADIPFSVTEEKYDTGLQILNSAPPENCAFCVPIAHYDKAVETLVGIGALDEDAIHELDREDEEFLETSYPYIFIFGISCCSCWICISC